MTGAKLWGNVNVLARCANEKRYLQVNVQATGNYVVAAASVARGGTLGPASVTLKRGRLDQLPPRTVLDISQVQDAVEPARSRAGTGHPAQYVAPGVAH
ncbi:flagellar basal body P-ring biosynthesis protein FlgA [Citrobacter amalonaticus]|nr:flagellar basal body P-ring biosynthesis protein FlgA [Citrobacter amalonaticus]